MKSKVILVYCAFLIICLCRCKRQELPVSKHNPGNVTTTTVNMDATYKWQIYFNLKNNTTVSQNLKTAWDLGFETSANGYHVILNTSKFMFVRNTGNANFTAITDTNGFSNNKKWDEPSGNIDSTAIGDWLSANNIYVIDRGYNETGVHQGFRKIQFQSVDANKYIVRLAQLNGTGDTTFAIDKDSTYNFTFLSFSNNQTPIIEPPKTTWDLVFTQYTHIFYKPTMPYLVTGCLHNRYNTKAVMDSSVKFINIDFNYAQQKILSPALNAIGYEWKEYSFTTSSYTIYSQMNFIIRDAEGLYFKLHFVSFYNQQGIKGSPQWEYQKL